MKRLLLLTNCILLVICFHFFAANAISATKVVSFATKPMGGTFFYVAAGMSSIFSKYANLKVRVEPTRGIKEWGPLMEAGQVELAMDNAVASGGAFRALGLWKVGNKRITKMRLLASGHETLMSFWTRPDTGIEKIEDFAGKKVVMETPPGAPNTAATGNIIEEYYKLKGKYNRVLVGSPPECTNALIEGKIDAYQFVPGPHIQQLRRTCGVKGVPVPKKAAEYIGKKIPGMYPAVIPKGMYGLEKDIPCIGWRAVVVARDDLDPVLAYKLLDVLYDHLDELHGVHPRAKQWVLANATKDPTIPFHPGAIRFYKDKGLWTPNLDKLNKRLMEE